jgi:ABC-type sugar transport system ATPase subunit
VRSGSEVGPISLDVAEGETVGLAGLVGSGRSELLLVLAGYRPLTAGELTFDGSPVGRLTPLAAMRRGIAFVPSDRKVDGLVLSLSVAENLMMVRTAGRSRLRRPSGDQLRDLEAILAAYHIKVPSLDAPVSTLSGGNQQKVMLAKWLSCGPRLILLEEPTRGVDVSAKAEIYGLIEAAKRAGCAVIVSSSENDELRELCDRVVVMARGRAVAELDREDATDAEIAHHSMGSNAVAA